MSDADVTRGFAGLVSLSSDITEKTPPLQEKKKKQPAAESNEPADYSAIYMIGGIAVAAVVGWLFYDNWSTSSDIATAAESTALVQSSATAAADTPTAPRFPNQQSAADAAGRAAEQLQQARTQEREQQRIAAEAARVQARQRALREKAARTLAAADDARIVRQIQRRLADAGYKPGVADGVAGARTVTAIRAYERDRNHKLTGIASPALLALMKSDAAKPQAEWNKRLPIANNRQSQPVTKPANHETRTATLADTLRRQIRFDASSVAGNPVTEFRIELTPSGRVRSVSIVKPSGLKAWDRAAARGIARVKKIKCGTLAQCSRGLTVRLGPKKQ